MFKKGYIQTPEHKEKIRQKLIGKKRNKQQKKNISCGVQKVKNRISELLKGRIVSDKTKKILAEKSKGNKSHLGFKHTKKTKKKCGLKNIGRVPWNKGLHKEDNEIVRKNVEAWSQSQRGKRQSEEFVRKRLKNTKKNKYTSCHIRKDLGHLCRSNPEANYCRYLDKLKIKYIYEPKGFRLSNGRLYFPDFYLPEFDMYVEFKGYMSPKAKEKIELFKKDYNDLYLKVIMQDSDEWKQIEKFGIQLISNWEKVA